jgi:hypothetical protein
MSQVVAELETAGCLVKGASQADFKEWAQKTAAEHRAALQAAAAEQSDARTLAVRLSSLKGNDPLVTPTLQMILARKIQDPEMLKHAAAIASQASDQSVRSLALRVIEFLMAAKDADADESALGLLNLWDVDASFVVAALKGLGDKIGNRRALVRSLLTGHQQNAQTVKALEIIAERPELPLAFGLLERSLAAQFLTFALTKFGPVTDVLPGATASVQTLSVFLKSVVQSNGFAAVYLDPSKKQQIQRVVQLLDGNRFANSAADLRTVVETLAPMLRKAGSGMVALELLAAGVQFPDFAKQIGALDFWEVIAASIESPRVDVSNAAIALASKLTVGDASTKLLFDSLVKQFAKTHSHAAYCLVTVLLSKVAGLDPAAFLRGLFSGLTTPNTQNYLQYAFNFRPTQELVGPVFWRAVSNEIGQIDAQCVAAVAIFYLRYQSEVANAVVSYEFIAAMLGFLYRQSAPFALIVPVLQVILNSFADAEMAVFLAHHQFIQYLGQLPLRYPGEQNVTAVLQQFAAAFDRAAK